VSNKCAIAPTSATGSLHDATQFCWISSNNASFTWDDGSDVARTSSASVRRPSDRSARATVCAANNVSATACNPLEPLLQTAHLWQRAEVVSGDVCRKRSGHRLKNHDKAIANKSAVTCALLDRYWFRGWHLQRTHSV